MLQEGLKRWAAQNGYRIAWGPVSILEGIRSEMDDRDLDDDFREEWLQEFRYPETDGTAVVLAVPQPGRSAVFEIDGGRVEAFIPPTYGEEIGRRTLKARLFEEIPEAEGELETIDVPLKSLAAGLGLVRYGRNNITYIEEYGSYFQLVGFRVQAEWKPYPGRNDYRPRAMKECEDCELCREACPTGAIPEDRFLIRAHECLTFHNEGDKPWPDDLPESAHHCLVGCMQCQEACPMNSGMLRKLDTGIVINKSETESLLGGGFPESATPKLRELQIDHFRNVLGRNLNALIKC